MITDSNLVAIIYIICIWLVCYTYFRLNFCIENEERLLKLTFSIYYVFSSFKPIRLIIMIYFGYLLYIPYIRIIIKDKLIYKHNKSIWEYKYLKGSIIHESAEYKYLVRYFKLKELTKKDR